MIGVYGVMAYSVVQRTRELGIRKALGASRQHVIQQVVGRGVILTVLGLVLGAIGAYLATGALEAYLFNLGTHDPLTFAGAVVALTGASLLACVLPARRAAAVDPLVALRADQ